MLKDISLQLSSGRIYGLKGNNGSGKTMLLRAICGFIFMDTGEIIVDGKQLGKEMSFPENTGVLIENPSFIEGYTGFQNLKVLSMIRNRVGDQELRESLIRVGLDPDDRRAYKKYSLGMKQRLGIACAIMEHPNLILLDEPVNALDENGIKLVRQILQEEKERGALIIVACHDKEELELLSDKIYTMAEGSITGETDEKKMEQN